MNPAATKIEKTATLLATCRAKLNILLAPQISQWRNVKVDGYSSLFDLFALPKDIRISQRNYTHHVSQITQKLKTLEANLRELEKLINTGKIDLVKGESESNAILISSQNLLKSLEILLESGAILTQAADVIRTNISLKALLPLAKLSVGSREKQFEIGLRVLYLITDNQEEAAGQANINDYFAEINKYEMSLRKINLSELPAVAGEIARHYIDNGLMATESIKNFLDIQARHLENELEPIKQIRNNINTLKAKPVDDLLAGAMESVKTIGQQISTLSGAQHAVHRLDSVPALINDIRKLFFTIKTDLLRSLKENIKNEDSLLNPDVLSAVKAEEFFTGFKGIVRILRFLLASLLGRGKIISTEEIKEKIVGILNTCRFYYGSDKKQLQKLKDFLADSLKDYQKPFPYEALYQLMKSSLADYGVVVENHVKNFPVDIDNPETGRLDTGGKFSKQKPITLAILTDRIDQRVSDLKIIR